MTTEIDTDSLLERIRLWAHALGFSQVGVAGVDLSDAEEGLLAWLAQGFHGQMDYMERHGLKRARPAELVPGTVCVLTARMDYLPPDTPGDWQDVEWRQHAQAGQAVVSLYARGRDYHKVLRNRLQKLADQIQAEVGPLGHRVFTDSAPVLEAELAKRSGLGWRGKHTLVLSREAGSMFFLGEIFLDLALPETAPTTAHCGQCQACIQVCPTQAIVAPGKVDARLCISYLTIEFDGVIEPHLRPLIGNHLYGCDDCQLACPWNKFAKPSQLVDFQSRASLQHNDLLRFLGWSEADFLRNTEGSPIRRIGYVRWQRNLAVVSGNALRQPKASAELRLAIRQHLHAWLEAATTTDVVREHLQWALDAPEEAAI
ncbi:tRNA epoxyqueuosine(34) reductase QueG [Lampropedia aestuarii]|uniref:tRNA epoxyqueuosine(34) reductase QueG n=1 Tax=Lampropedia aestuarii TaxID=2562762 RepID=UPI002468E872|nr:tRNA epoxyqueuosine(34) reductase QueG [Lampropedia aestuarii]MDH5857147.1 tRNA epoxyqueuosine(34) reductase QueG [Lampropedia aestuarii]